MIQILQDHKMLINFVILKSKSLIFNKSNNYFSFLKNAKLFPFTIRIRIKTFLWFYSSIVNFKFHLTKLFLSNKFYLVVLFPVCLQLALADSVK